MSEYEYFDEDGNPVDPAELGDDVEIVEEVDVEVDDELTRSYEDADEMGFRVDDDLDGLDVDFSQPEIADESAPATVSRPVVEQQPPPVVLSEPDEPQAEAEQSEQSLLDGRGKLLLLGAGAAVAAVVAGLAFGLGTIGDQNTAADVKAAGQSKVAAASSAVVSKSSAVRSEVADVTVDSCTGLEQAMVNGNKSPSLTLDIISSAPLPGPFIAARTNADGKAGTPSLLQLTKTNWGAYTTTPLTRAEKKAEIDKPGFHKVDVPVTGDSIRVTGDRVWAGGDTGGAGSCEPGEPGVYAAQGRVPADATGLVDGQASVDAIQGIAGQSDRAVALMGNSVVLIKLIETAK